jgi:hypothetical protein
MAYDFDDAIDRSPPKVQNDCVPQFNDLEYIITMLQLSAIFLTPTPDATFTLDELLKRAHEIEGEPSYFDDVAAKIVLKSCKFLKKVPDGKFSLK